VAEGLRGIRLALLEGQFAREILTALADQVGDRVADPCSFPGRERSPFRLSCPGRRHCAVDVLGARVRRFGERLAGDGRDDGAGALARGCDPLAADEVLESTDRGDNEEAPFRTPGATVPFL